MATQTIRKPDSGEYSLNGGKYHFVTEASLTTSSISYTMKVVVTKGFKKAHTFRVKSDKTDNTIKVKKKKKGTFSLGTDQLTSQMAGKITFHVDGGAKVSVDAGTIAYRSQDPKSPDSITLALTNDAKIDIVVTGTGYVTVPTNKIEIERCKDVYDTNSFSAIPSSPFTVSDDDNYIMTQTDQSSDVERGHRYWYRARAYNTLSEKYSAYIYSDKPSGGLYTSSNNEALSGGVTAARVSNNKVTLSWSITSVSYVNNKLVSDFVVYRMTNGGAPVEIATVKADTAHTQYTYTDTTCTPDNSYRYKIKIKGKGKEAETFSDESEEVYMSPCRPQNISVAHTSGGDVAVTITNRSKTATHVCIERRLDGGSWSQIAEEDYVEGGQVYQDDTATAADVIEYRVRNKCDQLTGSAAYSDYITSSAVIEKSVPNPPTLKAPVSGSTFALDSGSVRMSWQHNATDGSSQELAQLRYKKNSGSWTTVSLTTDSEYVLDITSGYSANDRITWQVRTRGACTTGTSSGYSDWSAEAVFTIMTKPQLTFTAPLNGDEITSLPINLAWNYSDLSGKLVQLSVDIKKDGVLEKTFAVPVGSGASGSYSYSMAGFLFENDTVYSITATALSSSGLSAVSDIAITVAYDDVALSGGLIPIASFDEDAIATIVIERDITPEEGETNPPEPVAISEAYLYRVHEGERTLVASGLNEGTQVEDKYAPVNVTFSYELLMLTTLGKVSIVTIDVSQDSPYRMIYWGDDEIAKAKWEPQESMEMTRPEKTQVRYSGRMYPVTYDSDAMGEKATFNAVITEYDEIVGFKRMMRAGAHGIWKSGDGDVFDADFEFSYTPHRAANKKYWECSLKITRTDGE